MSEGNEGDKLDPRSFLRISPRSSAEYGSSTPITGELALRPSLTSEEETIPPELAGVFGIVFS